MQLSLFANAANRALSTITGVPSKRDTLLSPSKDANDENSSPLKVFMDSSNYQEDSDLIKPFSICPNNKLEQNLKNDDFTLTLTSVIEAHPECKRIS